jgi:hypothetical protein
MKKVPNISKATRSYEEWLGRHMPLLQDDLDYKHKKMAESAFMFLRATYYRWIQLWDAACGNLQASPNVLAVGDIHFENFGTWRDCDGRLIWGINDFDEAAILPAALDIVRLAVSINLAVIEKSVALDPSVMIDALINGYTKHCDDVGSAFVLEEKNLWLRKIALNKLRAPEQYWKKFEGLAPAHASVFKPARRALALAMPAKSLDINYLRRTAGLGSLGRPRVVAIAKWGDSFVCREAKRVAPPASYWARGREKQKQINVMTIVRKQERIPDPYYHVRGKWTVRRLSPHCGKIELSSFSKEKTLLKLVAAMGAAIANIHAGSIERKILAADIRSRSKQIRKAVTKMTALTLNDWDAWKKTQRKSEKKRLKKEKSKA